jgi:hypothetical protein
VCTSLFLFDRPFVSYGINYDLRAGVIFDALPTFHSIMTREKSWFLGDPGVMLKVIPPDLQLATRISQVNLDTFGIYPAIDRFGGCAKCRGDIREV